MKSHGIQLICFDLGGVMVRLASNWQEVLQRAEIDEPLFDEDLYRNAGFFEAYINYETGRTPEDRFFARVAEITSLSPEAATALFHATLVEPYPGIDGLLDRLQDTAVQTACLSNTNPTHWRVLTCPGSLQLPLHRLDHHFTSHFIGHRKPAAEIYRHVQSQAAVEPSGILFFDDDESNCRAAVDQGWNAHRVDPDGGPIGQITEHLCHLGIL